MEEKLRFWIRDTLGHRLQVFAVKACVEPNDPAMDYP
jgi:hypothetical protein